MHILLSLLMHMLTLYQKILQKLILVLIILELKLNQGVYFRLRSLYLQDVTFRRDEQVIYNL